MAEHTLVPEKERVKKASDRGKDIISQKSMLVNPKMKKYFIYNIFIVLVVMRVKNRRGI